MKDSPMWTEIGGHVLVDTSTRTQVKNTVELISAVNIALLLLIIVYGYSVFWADEWKKESCSTGVVIIGGIAFNIMVIVAVRIGNGDVDAGILRLMSLIEELAFKTTDILLTVWEEFLTACANVLLCFYTLFKAIRSSKGNPENPKRKQLQSTDSEVFSPKIKRRESIRSYSEPTRTSANIPSIKKGHLLIVKEKYKPVNSPELFKNKIYVSRRSLIDSQDEDSQ